MSATEHPGCVPRIYGPSLSGDSRGGPIADNALVNSSGETAAAARERSEALAEILAQRILVLDGATGTWLQAENLTATDFGGEA